MTDATDRLHLAGLLVAAARIVAKDPATVTLDEREHLAKMLTDHDAGIQRGRVNRAVRAAPGEYHDPEPLPRPALAPLPDPHANVGRHAVTRAPMPTVHDYERNGPAPDLVAMMREKRTQVPDKRLPPERDDE